VALNQSVVDQGLGAGISGDITASRKKLADLNLKRDAAQEGLPQAQKDVDKIEGQTATEEQGVRQQMANFTPRESKLTVPDAPGEFEPKHVDKKEIHETAAIMMAIAGMFGAFTRNGMMGTLTSMTGMMKGYQEGDAELVKSQLEVYKTKQTEFKDKLEALKADRDRLDKMDQRDLSALRQQYELVAHKHDAELIAAKARVSSLTDTRKELDNQIKEMDKAVTAGDKTEATFRGIVERTKIHAQATAGLTGVAPGMAGKHAPGSNVLPALDANGYVAGTGMTLDALDLEAWKYINGQSLQSYGMGGNNAVKKVILDRAAELWKKGGGTPENFSASSGQFKADVSSLAKVQNRLDMVSGQLNSLHNNMTTFDQIARGELPEIGADRVKAMAPLLTRIDFSQIRSVNDIRLKIGEAVNDPTITAYMVSAMAVAMDVARIQTGPMSNAALAEGARTDAVKLVAAGVDDNARHALLGAIESDSVGQIKGWEQQAAAIRARMGHPGGASPGAPRSFGSEAEAEKAGLKPGEKIIINGVSGTWH
jgi:hypothetical protein